MEQNTTPSQEARCPANRGLRAVAAGLLGILILAATVYLVFATINEHRQGRYIGQDIERKNSITITGQGKIMAKPDIGMINLGVISDASTVATAQKDNTDKMNKVTNALKDLGVEEKDIKTISYNINPRYQYLSGRSDIIGYEISQSLEIKARNLDKVGQILSKAAELGANQVGSLTFTFDDPELLKVEARDKAIKDAKTKAEALADKLGVSLGRVINFTESSYQPEPPLYYTERTLGIGGGGDTPDIQTGQNEVAANISITYEIR